MSDMDAKQIAKEIWRRPEQPTTMDQGKHTRICMVCGKRFEVFQKSNFLGIVFDQIIGGTDPGPYCLKCRVESL